MDTDYFPLSTEEYSKLNFASIIDDSIDEYLYDPNLSLTDMIEKYDLPILGINEKKEKKNLRCTVCNARAFGYNFDQISCESCKAFFRRNALRDMKDLHCRFSGNCTITTENRRHCSYCRIKKCFAVGMRKEWIRSEEEKHKKRAQLEKSRRRKRTQQAYPVPLLMQPGRLNNILILSSTDRTRLNNITHCYDQYAGEPSISRYRASSKPMSLRLDEFFNRKKNIIIDFITYFKRLPELQILDVDDQVFLIKQNIRLLLPLNYALLKAPEKSKIGTAHIETIGCVDNANLHDMFRSLSDIFVQFVTCDPIIIKLLVIVLFFTTNSLTTRSIFDSCQFKQLNYIKQIQSSYTELLWVYMIEKCGEEHAIHLFTKMISKYLYVQIIMDQIDSIVRSNNDVQSLDSLLKTVLQLT